MEVPHQRPRYTYTTLKEAITMKMKTANIIAVVKFCKNPEKTKGSGYSLFCKITDPSVEGLRFPCIFFHDKIEKLPQIQCPGDVIVMHRLVLNEFQHEYQGCGYGTKGFAAAVFPGKISDPLTPRPSLSVCSFGPEEENTVRELIQWFTPPEPSVEEDPLLAENLTTSELWPLRSPTSSTKPDSCAPASAVFSRLSSLKAKQFVDIEGQIVGIYRYPEVYQCTLLYIWDGLPETAEGGFPVFVIPPTSHINGLLPHAIFDPELVAISGHGFWTKSPNERPVDDLSVPVFLYDNHANDPPTPTLRPGDLIRIKNVHVDECRVFSCERPNCLRPIVHRGRKYGRGVEFLGSKSILDDFRSWESENPGEDRIPEQWEDINRHSLLSRLSSGHSQRRPCLRHSTENKLTPLTVAQLYDLPRVCSLSKSAEPLPLLNDSVASPFDLFSSCELASGNNANSPRTAVYAHLIGRVVDAAPRTAQCLKDSLLLVCKYCKCAVRLSCLPDVDKLACHCPDSPETDWALMPFLVLQLEDATGAVLAFSLGRASFWLLNRNGDSTQNAVSYWKNVLIELSTSNDVSTMLLTNEVVEKVTSLIGGWVDLSVKVSWKNTSIPIVSTCSEELDIRIEIVD
ncbi:unnamed protein product [Calicophoron daubneyi]|uniref:Protection of telomeres protein 1 n=1 Tax=Calicophoron daubneyi TaxID=300641 RepID=A0AAV2TAB7_CALDB